ncbi:MAG: hypothetical protein ACI9U2_005043 [Bradymonadia bacterium]|jgi:hypothetical protein
MCTSKVQRVQRDCSPAAKRALEPPGIAAGLQTAQQNSSGQPMGDSVRADMESSLGADFTGVRVHTDSAAAQASKELNAHAFTNNNDVFFGAGEYAPGSDAGRTLLAHELTHVKQGSDDTQTRVSSPGEGAENEAEAAAETVAQGGHVGEVSQQAAPIARDAAGDFKEAASTHWMGLVAVDPVKALAELRKMTQAERAALVTDDSNHPYLERVFAAANAATAISNTLPQSHAGHGRNLRQGRRGSRRHLRYRDGHLDGVHGHGAGRVPRGSHPAQRRFCGQLNQGQGGWPR